MRYVDWDSEDRGSVIAVAVVIAWIMSFSIFAAVYDNNYEAVTSVRVLTALVCGSVTYLTVLFLAWVTTLLIKLSGYIK